MRERSSTSFLAIMLMAFTFMLAIQGGSAWSFFHSPRSRQSLVNIRKAFPATSERLQRNPQRRLLADSTRPPYAMCTAGTLEGYATLNPNIKLYFCQDCVTEGLGLGNNVTITKTRIPGPWPADLPPDFVYTDDRTKNYTKCDVTRCPAGMTFNRYDMASQFWFFGTANNRCKGTLPATINNMPDDNNKFLAIDALCKSKLGTQLATTDTLYMSEPGQYACLVNAFPTFCPICKRINNATLTSVLNQLNATRPVENGVSYPSDREALSLECQNYESFPSFDP